MNNTILIKNKATRIQAQKLNTPTEKHKETVKLKACGWLVTEFQEMRVLSYFTFSLLLFDLPSCLISVGSILLLEKKQ